MYINQHAGNKTHPLSCLLGSICWACCINAAAEVVTDGSLGSAGIQTLTGQNYHITENLGQRQGNNVFHSFSHFNVLSGETATFQVHAGTENILARVTGNEVSSINGTVSTGGSQANLWLINPQGWMVGSGARFDINGAFHLTAANAVGFSDGAKFYADPAHASHLSLSAPLTLELDKPTQAAITIEQADLQFKPHQTVSLTAPKLTLNKSALTVPGGQLLLGGLSSGVWSFDQQGLKGSAVASGEIAVNGYFANAKGASMPISTSQRESAINGIKTSAIDGGHIQLLAGTINLNSAFIDQPALSGGKSGDVALQARSINLENATTISVNVERKGDAGNITVLGDRLLMSNSHITAKTSIGTMGNAGIINVNLSQQLTMNNKAFINSDNFGSGTGATINVKADLLSMNHAYLSVNNRNGHAGTLTINANAIRLENLSTLDSSTFSGSKGNGGNITIQAQQLSLTDPQTFITSKAFGAGHGGLIAINTDRLNILNQAEIRASSEDTGDAGKIQLTVNNLFWLENARVTTAAQQSNGGAIELATNTAFLRHGQITTSVGDLSSNGSRGGKGGDISVKASNLVMDGGFIQANTAGEHASGGNIHIDAERLFAGGNQVSVGNLERLPFNPHSQDNVIQAAAPAGNPGNIHLRTVELNIAGQLLPLDSRFLTQRVINDNPCHVTRGQQLSSLVSIGHGSLPVTAAEPASTSLEHYLTPAAITSLLPAGGQSSSALVCPDNPL